MLLLRNIIIPLTFVIVISVISAPPAAADDPVVIWWTGAAEDDNNWSTAGNWSGNAVPQAGDIVRLGFADGDAVADSPQIINLDITTEVLDLEFRNQGNRAVTLESSNGSTLQLSKDSSSAASPLMRFYPGDAATTIDVHIEKTGTGSRGWHRFDNTEQVTFGPNHLYTTNTGSFESTGSGPARLGGEFDTSWRARSAMTLTMDGFVGGGTTWDSGMTVLMESTASMSNLNIRSSEVTIQRLGAGDRSFDFGFMSVATRSNIPHQDFTTNPLLGVANTEDPGTLTIRLNRIRILAPGVQTDTDTVVEIYSASSAGDRLMEFGGDSPNAGISGPGALRLALDAPEHVFSMERLNSYTGNTILAQGILAIGQHQVTGNQRSGSGTFGTEEGTGSAYRDDLSYGFELGTYYGGLPETTVVEINENATLRLNANVGQTIGGLMDHDGTSGSVDFQGSTLTVNATTDTAFGGDFEGGGTFIKTGPASLALTGTNTFDGDTIIEGGLLAVNGSLAASPVTVESGGQLGGSGTLGSAVNVLAGGALAPGNSPGTLTFEGDLIFAANSAVHFDIGEDGSDLIALAGTGQTLSSTGPVLWHFTANGDVLLDTAYLLLDWSAASGLDGFGFSSSDLEIASSGWEGDFSFIGDGLYVSFTAIPEPAHAAMLFAAIVLLAALRKKSARK